MSLVKTTHEIDYGKIPPQAKDLEIAVLGAILLEKDAIIEIQPILKPEMFYLDAHQRVYKAIMQLVAKNEPIDVLTVSQELKEMGRLDAVGGVYALAVLTNSVSSAANSEAHARIIKEMWIKREQIVLATRVINEAYEDESDAIELLNRSSDMFSNLLNSCTTNRTKNFADAVNDKVLDVREAAMNSGDQKYVLGKRTGLYSLDRKSLGYQDGNLIILAGRPAEGKTSMALQGAHLNAAHNIPTGIFSLEMGTSELLDKMFSAETNIDSANIRTGKLKQEEWERFNKATTVLEKYPLYIDDTAGLSISEIEATARVWVKKHGVQIIFLDYLQLVTIGGKKTGNREQEISEISRRLKILAKKLNIPIIALCQLSREMDKRPAASRRPILTDLRESGAIEQDADVVIFIFRPEEHGIETYSETGTSTRGVTEITIAKNRMGAKGMVFAKFRGSSNKFTDEDYSKYAQSYDDPKDGVQEEMFDKKVAHDSQDLPF